MEIIGKEASVKDIDRMKKMTKPIIQWYQENKRELPWRKEKNPYHIWISEIMLQQTRIEAVKQYYKRFLEELPTIEHLAQIEEERDRKSTRLNSSHL